MKKEKSYKAVLIRNTIIDAIKHLAFPVILAAIIFVGVYAVLNYTKPEEKEELVHVDVYEGTQDPIIIENNDLKLTMDPLTTQFTILVKSTGAEWTSSPVGAAENASVLPAERDRLLSAVLMTYSIESGLETEYSTNKYSIANKLYEIEYDADHIRVNYSIGDVEKEYILPPVILAEEFEEWLTKFEKRDLNTIDEFYKKYDINKLSKKDAAIKDELLEKYPIMADEVIYVLMDAANGNMKKEMERIFADAGYTDEDYQRHKEMLNAERTSDKPIFKVSIDYRLDGKDLIATVPMNSLGYKDEYPMSTVTMLPYFGAGGADDEGFMVVPSGGGGVIKFNNGKTMQNAYSAKVYGWDYVQTRTAVVHDPIANYGVYGISKGDNSFLCVMEEGSSYATVQADIGGKNHPYNFVNTKYEVCSKERYDLGDQASLDVYVFLPELPDENYVQRYTFIDSADYNDMAKTYQTYLAKKYGNVLTANNDSSTPVAIEIVGAVDKVKQILGVPVSRPLPLTTFEEAEGIINQLKSEGMDNMSVKLSGWCNGGENQKILKKVKPVSSLGGKSGLEKLTATANSLGVDLYLDGVTTYEYNSNILDGFNSFTDAAKKLSKERAEQYKYSAITYAARENWKSYYLLHTSVAMNMMDNLAAAADKYNTQISFREVGMDLASDFYRKDTRSRESVLNEQVAKLKEMSASKKLMINQGNSYAVPYATFVTNMDLRGSEYSIIDEYVPFYQMAIHGLINYTGFPINICGNEEDQILYSAEYGAGLMFTLMDESSFSLQKTLYTEYYGSEMDAWHDRMMNIYNRYNSELGHIFNQKMVKHENLTEELACTTYADGTKVYVNYSYEAVSCPDGTVPARDYMVVK